MSTTNRSTPGGGLAGDAVLVQNKARMLRARRMLAAPSETVHEDNWSTRVEKAILTLGAGLVDHFQTYETTTSLPYYKLFAEESLYDAVFTSDTVRIGGGHTHSKITFDERRAHMMEWCRKRQVDWFPLALQDNRHYNMTNALTEHDSVPFRRSHIAALVRVFPNQDDAPGKWYVQTVRIHVNQGLNHRNFPIKGSAAGYGGEIGPEPT